MRAPADSNAEDAVADEQTFEATRQDPPRRLAEQYTFAAMKLAAGYAARLPFNTRPPEAHEALDTIEWYAIPVSSKVHRALTRHARAAIEDDDTDPIASD